MNAAPAEQERRASLSHHTRKAFVSDPKPLPRKGFRIRAIFPGLFSPPQPPLLPIIP
jgi:hypothetical protein